MLIIVTIDIQSQLKPNYAHVRCQGSFAPDLASQILESAFGIAAAEGRPAVLLDIRGLVGAIPSVGDRYDFGVQIAALQRGIGKGILMSVVGNEPMIDPDGLGEMIARSHGAYVGVFSDIGDAIEWIETEVGNVREGLLSEHWPKASH